MGIDLPHVRYVLHWSMSKSIEGFYQESGRAGRDTKQALSILYYSKSDADKFTFLIKSNLERKKMNALANNDTVSEADASKSLEAIQKMINYCTDASCRRQMILDHFGEINKSVSICKGTCDYCHDPDKYEEAMKFLSSTTSSNNDFPQFSKSNGSTSKINNKVQNNKVGFVKAGSMKKIVNKQSSSRAGTGGGFIKASKLKM